MSLRSLERLIDTLHVKGVIDRKDMLGAIDRVAQDIRREGLIEGVKTEARATLMRVLSLRFGQLEDWVLDRVYHADVETLRGWVAGLARAKSARDAVTSWGMPDETADEEDFSHTLGAKLREEGLREGQKALASDALVSVLRARFGEPDESARARIRAADIETLRTWVDRALTARSAAEAMK